MQKLLLFKKRKLFKLLLTKSSDMEKKRTIFSIVVIILLIFLVFLFYKNFKAAYLPEAKESNLIELRYNFSQYMTKKVDAHLNAIECKPTSYTLNSTEVCFVCNKLDACFGYVWVDKGERMMMNPNRAPILRNNYDEDDLLDFYSYGVSRILECKYNKDKKEYECKEGIKAKIEAVGPEFEFPMEMDVKEKLEEITNSECEFEVSPFEENVVEFSCSNIVGKIRSNEILIEGFV